MLVCLSTNEFMTNAPPEDRTVNEFIESNLNLFGLSRQDFDDLLQFPYDEAMALARLAALGDNVGIPVVRAREFALELNVQDSATPAELLEAKTCKILLDQILQFYTIFAFGRMSPSELNRRVRITGFDRFEAAFESGRGVCLVNSHFGPGHLAALILAKMGYEVSSMIARDLYRGLGIRGLDRPPSH